MNGMKQAALWLVVLQAVFGVVGSGVAQARSPLQGAGEQLGRGAGVKAELKEESEQGDESSARLQPFDAAVKGLERIDGLLTLYRDKQTGKLYAEIKPEQLNQNFLCNVTMESGLGEAGFYRGIPLQYFLFYFQRVNNNLHFVVRNVNFRTQPGDPAQRSIDRSFTDSVLHSLKIKSIHPQRKSLLVDLGPLLLSDLPGFSSMLADTIGSYSVDASKTYFSSVKAFPLNLEIESTFGLSGGDDVGAYSLPTLPDSRALSLRVHYSLSQLPAKDGYVPRLADDRVGYFVTTYRDFSADRNPDPYVRYINRWHLEKQDPNAPLSPPKKPIVFWIENTVPLEYRQAMREGVLMWNKAFEAAGFKDAIEVRQMPDNATWDPADIRYNTIRWFNSVDAYFALGPSRVDPLTGEILDADIIIDSNFVRSGQQEFQALMGNRDAQSTALAEDAFCPAGRLASKPGQADSPKRQQIRAMRSRFNMHYDLCYGQAATRQAAAGALSLVLLHNTSPTGEDMKEYVRQFLRETVAHEVGHTLGLTHNFHGSTLLKPDELNNLAITQTRGLTGSVMDYNAPNIAPRDVKQGDYYTSLVGPYDVWAIEYGYTPSGAKTARVDADFANKIARRSGTEPALAYGNDEDAMAAIDPSITLFDLSSDMLTYTQWQMDNAREMWQKLDQRYSVRGDSVDEVRQMFSTIFFHYFRNAIALPDYVAGQSINRDRSTDPKPRLPLEPVDIAQQRQALAILQKYVFDDSVFQFSPDLLNKLVPSRWLDWTDSGARLDYPIYNNLFSLQKAVLFNLLAPERLERLRDNEMRAKPGKTLLLPELFDTLQTSIWKEVVRPTDQPIKLSSLRRALQREYLELQMGMVLRTEDVPDDARTLAWYNLKQLRSSLDKTLSRQGRDMDTYTKAHLQEVRARIAKTLDAPLQSQ